MALEKSLLDRFMPSAKWGYPQVANMTYVEWTYQTATSKRYTLRVYPGTGYPTSCPILCLVSPQPLKKRDGSVVEGTSHGFHTLGSYDGFLKLCHYLPSRWSPEETIYKVRG